MTILGPRAENDHSRPYRAENGHVPPYRAENDDLAGRNMEIFCPIGHENDSTEIHFRPGHLDKNSSFSFSILQKNHLLQMPGKNCLFKECNKSDNP